MEIVRHHHRPGILSNDGNRHLVETVAPRRLPRLALHLSDQIKNFPFPHKEWLTLLCAPNNMEFGVI